MNNKEKLDKEIRRDMISLWFLFFLVALLIVLIMILSNIKSEGTKCQKNPLVYGAEKYSKSNHADMVGTASFLKENSPTIFFNKYNLTVEFPNSLSQVDVNNFNLSLIEISK